MTTRRAGAATVDFTPPPGLLLAGYAARTGPATGTHDPLTARALVLGDTAIVVADVIGIDQSSSARIRAACGLPPGNVVVAATHTHAAPVSMPGRLGALADPAFVAALENACIAAIRAAVAGAVPASLAAGYAAPPAIARNRRHEDGPVDDALPVLRVTADDGRVLAILVTYACHPTVLAADNRLMSADYPHFVRAEIEAAHPGATALFLTGCAGDANDGHAASASWTAEAIAHRDFAEAERIGRAIGRSALVAELAPVAATPTVWNDEVTLAFDRPEGDLAVAGINWQAELDAGAQPPRSLLLPYWVAWARRFAATLPGAWQGRISLLDLGGAVLAGLPGEPFARTALDIRAAAPGRVVFPIGYADDNPGYIPPRAEYPFGGYEVDEAHRFYATSGRFAPGGAEELVVRITRMLQEHSLSA